MSSPDENSNGTGTHHPDIAADGPDHLGRGPRSTDIPHQKYSLYHQGGTEDGPRAMFAPYLDVFAQCRSILDIGCGPGTHLGMLQERGVSVMGLDVDPQMVEACHARGIPAEVGEAKSVSAFHEEFDGILANHIIEHMPGEAMVAFLEGCVSALRPNGLLMVKTPNWANETVRHGGFWLDHTHVRPYPLPLLERIFADLGLEVAYQAAEPVGWNDLVIIGRKPAIPTAGTTELPVLPPQPWPLATDRAQRLLAWPTWHSKAELTAILEIVRGQTGRDDLCLCLRLDPQYDPPLAAALVLLDEASADVGADLDDVAVLIVDDPMFSKDWPRLGAAVNASLAPSGTSNIDDKRERFLQALGCPKLRTSLDADTFFATGPEALRRRSA